MDKLDIIIYVMAGGFSVIFGLMLLMWHHLISRMDRSDYRMDKLDEKLNDVDRRLCCIEGALSAKDCCMLKSDEQLKKAG